MLTEIVLFGLNGYEALRRRMFEARKQMMHIVVEVWTHQKNMQRCVEKILLLSTTCEGF